MTVVHDVKITIEVETNKATTIRTFKIHDGETIDELLARVAEETHHMVSE